jgi:hypothetical protein
MKLYFYRGDKMSEKDVWQEEEKESKSQKVAEFVVEAGKEVVITALTTAVAIGVGILMHKDN